MNVLKSLPLVLALAAGWSSAHAAADFTTVWRGRLELNDATPRLYKNFTLPSNVNRSSSGPNSAVLDLEVMGSQFNYNEVYINPAQDPVCTDDAEDAHQSVSVDMLQDHDDPEMRDEWATNHITFSSALLKAGSNQIMICARNMNGDASQGDLDDMSVRSIVLHFHTTP